MCAVSPSPSLLSASGLTVKRQGTLILDHVNLTILPEDFITIIGPNGAGKSLLLKCLMGLFKPDAGIIHRKTGLTLGYVPQRLHVDYVMPITTKAFLRLSRYTNASELEQVIGETAISHILSKPLFSLSGGELQRVLLARALLGKPEILILDEPAQNLDISGQLAFYALLERLYEERRLSILMVSHDLHLVMRCSRQVICLFHHICCEGTPQHVAADPAFTSLFGDHMSRMMAIYHHVHDHSHQHGQANMPECNQEIS